MNEQLEKQIKITKKALKPSHNLYDGCKQMLALIEMFYIYLEKKFDDDTGTNPRSYRRIL